jgi:2,3-bisphosphoglycerate-independent phosphoglycerate mutase
VLQAGKGHRLVGVVRGPGLGGDVSDADPHKEGKPTPPSHALTPGAGNDKTARIVNAFLGQARAVLANDHPANAALMRGLSERPKLAGYPERYKLRAAAIAAYPMYRGVAQLAGMSLFPVGEDPADAFAVAKREWANFDFFFIHMKATDMAGEDGAFANKVAAIEAVDRAMPELLALEPDVLCVTGDHSTPVLVKGHSWHPVPALVAAPYCFADGFDRFHEKHARTGSLGTMESRHLMPVLLANAGRLDKFGA